MEFVIPPVFAVLERPVVVWYSHLVRVMYVSLAREKSSTRVFRVKEVVDFYFFLLSVGTDICRLLCSSWGVFPHDLFAWLVLLHEVISFLISLPFVLYLLVLLHSMRTLHDFSWGEGYFVC